MFIKKFVRGCISYIPVLKSIIPSKGMGGTNDAAYCHSIYTKHKGMLIDNGCAFPFESICEIGHGDTIGVGLCALVDGARSYCALDAIAHSSINKNLSVFNDIVKFYESRHKTIRECILDEIEQNIKGINTQKAKIKYCAPWWNNEILDDDSLDVIISTAVMEHILSLKEFYVNTYNWLKPGGFCSHIIDYSAHEFSDNWCEHWYYSDMLWSILMHGRMYPINRKPHSYHIDCIEKAGFSIQEVLPSYHHKAAVKKKISNRIVDFFTDSDLKIKSAIIVARKPL